MAKRLQSLLALVILSAFFLVQFQFNIDGTDGGSANTSAVAWKAGGGESAKCKGSVEVSDRTDCKINRVQSFCQAPQILADDNSEQALDVSFHCRGPNYDAFGTAFRAFASDVSQHGDSWGRRAYGIPSNKVILFLGNSDTQQVAQALACRHVGDAHMVQDVQPAVVKGKTAQKIHFSNNSTMIILTDDTVARADDVDAALYAETGLHVADYDGMIWGLFHDCGSVVENCANTTQGQFHKTSEIFSGPMLFISMMADARSTQALPMRDVIRKHRSAGRRNVWFISGRRYISQVKLEGATISGNGDADNVPKTGRYGHRCTGPQGGHPDLLGFDITEFLYHQLFYVSGKTS
jgi:hypothetical protein